jgi:hypothetical protein
MNKEIKDWFRKQWSTTAVILLSAFIICAFLLGSQAYKLEHKLELYQQATISMNAELREYTYFQGPYLNMTQMLQTTPAGWSLLAYGKHEPNGFIDMSIMENATKTLYNCIVKEDSAGNISITFMMARQQSDESVYVLRYGGKLKKVNS